MHALEVVDVLSVEPRLGPRGGAASAQHRGLTSRRHFGLAGSRHVCVCCRRHLNKKQALYLKAVKLTNLSTYFSYMLARPGMLKNVLLDFEIAEFFKFGRDLELRILQICALRHRSS